MAYFLKTEDKTLDVIKQAVGNDFIFKSLQVTKHWLRNIEDFQRNMLDRSSDQPNNNSQHGKYGQIDQQSF